MDSKVEAPPTFADTAKLAAAGAVVIAGIVAYYYFENSPALLRALGVLVSLALAAWIGLQSAQGRALWKFIQAARIELRKVVWPTREETIQTTVAVLLLAMIGGVFFWGLDFLLLWATSRITGQGG